jgi:hypothetical protein
MARCPASLRPLVRPMAIRTPRLQGSGEGGVATNRHRFNRGGDQIANNALWRIVLVRMSSDPRTRNYVERRTKERLSKKEIIRCLKRFVAREVYRRLVGE